MFTIFRSFFTEGGISGMLNVSVDATGYIVPATATGFAIGTVEPFTGNVDSQFDVNANAALPVNVRLFGPTRFCAATGIATTGFSAGAPLYQAASGFVSTASAGSALLVGVALSSIPGGSNGVRVEVAEVID
jgi:hypothetical protein